MSGSHGRSCGAATDTTCSRRVAASSEPPGTPMIPSSSWPIGKYGVAAWYRRHCAVRTGMPAARRSISLKNRDLPAPGSPTISITPPRPDVSPSMTGTTRARSSSRPTSGSSAPATSARTPRAGPTEKAVTGRRLPLTKNGSSASVSNKVRELSSTDAVARSCPGCARAITRAARFTASPITV